MAVRVGLLYPAAMSAAQYRLYHRLQLAAHRLKKAADRTLVGVEGLTAAQGAVLAVIAAEGRPSQRRVAAVLGLNESAMTAMVGRLMTLGAIERLPSPDDSRAWSLQLTETGLAALQRIETSFATINSELDTILDAAEADRLADYLARIEAAFAT